MTLLIITIPVLLFSISTCFISATVLIFIFTSIRPLISNVPIILTCNTYFAIFLSGLIGCTMKIHVLIGYMNSYTDFNDDFCEFRGYLIYGLMAAFYYSCVLQAVFRLIRIVFYQKKKLQSVYVMFSLIIAKWIISLLYVLLNLYLKTVAYNPMAQMCLVSFYNVPGMILSTIFVYFISSTTIFSIYTVIVRYSKRTSHSQLSGMQKKRDLLVMKRIVMIYLALIAVGIPSTIILFYYIISGSLNEFGYEIQTLSSSLGLLLCSIGFAIATPQIQDRLTRRARQIAPTITFIANHRRK